MLTLTTNTTPTLHVGAPTEAGPLSAFPVWTDAPMPRRALHTRLPEGAQVTEAGVGGPQVERLVVHNPTTTPFLLPVGTVFDGGLQHRVLVNGALVGGRMDLDLDVRCVEHGRWSGAEQHRVHHRRAPLAVRGALRGVGGPRVRPGGARDGLAASDDLADQGDVWRRVRRYEAATGPSTSQSLVEMTDRLHSAEGGNVGSLVGDVRPLPGQRGVIIGIAGHPVLAEVFDHPATLARQWDAIVLGVLADALLAPDRPTPAHRARTFARRLSGRRLDPWLDGPDAGTYAAADNLALVEALVTRADRTVHLSALNIRHQLVAAA